MAKKVERDALLDVILVSDSKKESRRRIEEFRDESIFNKYRKKVDIISDILNELSKSDVNSPDRYYFNEGKDGNPKGFFTSVGNESEVGIITHCQTISLFVSLFENGDDSIEKVRAFEDKILYAFEMIKNELGYSSNKVISNREGKLNFVYSASPFLDDKNDKNLRLVDYVDTMAKVLTAASDFRFYLLMCKKAGYEVENHSNLLADAEKIILGSMSDLSNSAIKYEGDPLYFTLFGNPEYIDSLNDEQKEKYLIEYIGWNFVSSTKGSREFTSKNYEMSLYYTYSVCRAYITFANYFKPNIDLQRKYRNYISKSGINVAEERKNTSGFSEVIDDMLDSLSANERERFEMNKEFFSYEVFNNYFFKFSKCVLHAGYYVDMQLSELDVSNSFVGNGFTDVTMQELENSSSNDSLFNTLFSLAILFYAGLDIDYKYYFDGTSKENESRNDQDTFYSDINFALSNVQRCLAKLQKEKKEYIVDQKFLSISERIPLTEEYVLQNARKIRKKRIQAITISPLIIRVHSEISKYLIKFPERSMESYLRQIVENRCQDENGNYIWAWDGDGYDLNITLNYIESLADFFEYYDHYERDFLDKQETIQNTKASLKAAHKAELDSKDREIEELKKQLDDVKKQKAPIVTALETFLSEYLKENLLSILAGALDKAVYNDSLNKDGNNYHFYQSFKKFLASFVFELKRGYTDKLIYVDPMDNKTKLNEEEANKIIEAFTSKFDADIVKYASQAVEENEEK